jgi:hypothetical protein
VEVNASHKNTNTAIHRQNLYYYPIKQCTLKSIHQTASLQQQIGGWGLSGSLPQYEKAILMTADGAQADKGRPQELVVSESIHPLNVEILNVERLKVERLKIDILNVERP